MHHPPPAVALSAGGSFAGRTRVPRRYLLMFLCSETYPVARVFRSGKSMPGDQCACRAERFLLAA